MPSYQTTPVESAVGSIRNSRHKPGSHSAKPPRSPSTSTLVDNSEKHEQPAVLKSVYVTGTGWASQVRDRM